MVDGLDVAGRILVEDDLYVIRDHHRIVWVDLRIPRNVDPLRGAAAGRTMADYLIEHVLQRRSSWIGVIVDIRQGPTVVGPITLANSERALLQAEQTHKRLAMIVKPTATHREQYLALQRSVAPRFVVVTDDPRVALDWMTQSR